MNCYSIHVEDVQSLDVFKNCEGLTSEVGFLFLAEFFPIAVKTFLSEFRGFIERYTYSNYLIINYNRSNN